MRNKVDLRVLKTEEAIKRTFKEMLLEMPYEKITIKELCERAIINRKTFYLHYNSIEDVSFINHHDSNSPKKVKHK